MIEKLRILSPDRMLPERFGGYIRTYNNLIRLYH